VRKALSAGIAPDSAEAQPILDAVMATLGAAEGTEDSPAFRGRVLGSLRAGTDARAERYWRLLATINGWPTWPESTPAFEWIIGALQGQ
jgi:hypothetical protein